MSPEITIASCSIAGCSSPSLNSGLIDFAATLRDKTLEGKPSAMSLSQIRMHQKGVEYRLVSMPYTKFQMPFPHAYRPRLSTRKLSA